LLDFDQVAPILPVIAIKSSTLDWNDHTGEEVLVAAQGPGAPRVRGILSNTDLFQIVMAAYGWK
jgi:alkaline phosphatase